MIKKLYLVTNFWLITFISIAQLQSTSISSVYSYKINTDRGIKVNNINDSFFLIKKSASYLNDTFLIVNVNSGETYDKIFLQDDYINSINPINDVMNNDIIFFVSNRLVDKAKRKFNLFYMYTISTKQLVPVEFNKSILPKMKDYVYINYEHSFVDKLQNNLYFTDYNSELIIKYNIASNTFSTITNLPIDHKNYTLAYVHKDYLYFRNTSFGDDSNQIKIVSANNLNDIADCKISNQNSEKFFQYNRKSQTLYLKTKTQNFIVNDLKINAIETTFKENLLQAIKGTEEKNKRGFKLFKNGNTNNVDTLKFANEVLTDLTLNDKIIVFLNTQKADINYVKEIPRAYKEAWARQDSLKRVLAQKVLDEIYKKNNKVEEPVTITKTPSATSIYSFFETFNVYRTFNGGEVRGDFQELKWQVRFKTNENSIDQYWEKDGFPGTSFKLYQTFNVMECKKTEAYKYVYVINNNTAIFYNTNSPISITITKDGGKTFTEYATYDSYYKKFK